MAAALLAPGVTTLRNVDRVADLDVMIDVLRAVGADVTWTGERELTIDASGPLRPGDAVRARHAVARVGERARPAAARAAARRGSRCRVATTSAAARSTCTSAGLDAMGADLDVVHGFIEARATRLVGRTGRARLPEQRRDGEPAHRRGARQGHTVIENAAREPEITELAAMLNRMGAQCSAPGRRRSRSRAWSRSTPVDVELIGDRIEAGTLLMACGIAGGEITIEGARIEHVELVAVKLGEMGLKVSPTPDGIWARADERLRAVDVATLPFPGFATDFMPLVVALLATADGTAIVTENVFDNRLGFVAELNRMGADVRHEGRHAVVRGRGAPLGRAGAGARRAGRRRAGARRPRRRGRDRRARPVHVDRGYPDLAATLPAPSGPTSDARQAGNEGPGAGITAR